MTIYVRKIASLSFFFRLSLLQFGSSELGSTHTECLPARFVNSDRTKCNQTNSEGLRGDRTGCVFKKKKRRETQGKKKKKNQSRTEYEFV